jgi:hypothetical protein
MMKKQNLFFLASLLITIAFCGCEEFSTTYGEDKILMSSSSIMSFEDEEDLLDYINDIQQHDDAYRIELEDQNNFVSFGSMADTLYRLFPQDSLAVDSLADYVEANSDFLSLDEDDNNEWIFNTKYDGDLYYYVMNTNRMYIVGEFAYKAFPDGLLVASTELVDEMEAVEEEDLDEVLQDEDYSFISNFSESKKKGGKDVTYNEGSLAVDRATSGSNRTYLRIKLQSVSNTRRKIQVSGIVRPYKRIAYVWFFCKRTITSEPNKVLVHFFAERGGGWDEEQVSPYFTPPSSPVWSYQWAKNVSGIDPNAQSDTHFGAFHCKGKTPNTQWAELAANTSLLI